MSCAQVLRRDPSLDSDEVDVRFTAGFLQRQRVLVADGRILNSSFADYRLLRACDAPEIVPIIVESNEPTGPYGAKGIGEGCMVNVASAISNAICHATGVRLTDLPMTPESILRELTRDEMK